MSTLDFTTQLSTMASCSAMLIFGITSLLNVILPIIFMLFNPTTSMCWYKAERIVSIILFIIGIITMCGYIYSLFPKKEVKGQEVE